MMSLENKIYSLPQAKKLLHKAVKELRKKNPHKDGEIQVFRLEIPIEPQDILGWLAQQPPGPLLYWANRDRTLQVGGIGIADEIDFEHLDYTRAFEYFHALLSSNYRHMRYFGGFAFDPDHVDQDWGSFGLCHFWLPRFEIVRYLQQTFLACNIVIKVNAKDVYRKVTTELGKINVHPLEKIYTLPSVIKRVDFPGKDRWLKLISEVLDNMGYLPTNPKKSAKKEADNKKIVLARRTVLQLSCEVNPFEFLKEITLKTDQCFYFCFQVNESTAFLGASPERLYQRQGRMIASEAIAGTRPRGVMDEENEKLKTALLNSQKDLKEHLFVDKFLRNELGSLCQSVQEIQSLSVLELKDSFHLVSRYEGQLKEDVFDDAILDSLHPTPAVAGNGQIEILKLIAQCEPFSRGWYAGPIGYISHSEVEFAVAIRSCLMNKKQLSLYAGAGIVKGSIPEEEWQEIENKIQTFLKILQYAG